MTPKDTAAIRSALKRAGLKIERCALGGNRFYILVKTNDNATAIKAIESNGVYNVPTVWRDSTDKIKIEKVTL